MTPIEDRHSMDAVVAEFTDGVAEVIAIGLKLRTRATRGVDREAEAQFRKSYEQQREDLIRWLTEHLDEATTASPYEIAATLTDTSQDSLLDPKTRGMLVNLRKEFLEALPRVATPAVLHELGDALRVIAESGAYPPTSVSNLALAMAERFRRWPAEPADKGLALLAEALPIRPAGRGRASSDASPRKQGEGVGRSNTEARRHGEELGEDMPKSSVSPCLRVESSAAAPADTGSVLQAIFATGPDASRAWAQLVATMSGPPEPPADPEPLVTAMSALPPQAREASCKRMRLTLPDWCAACGQAHLNALGRSAPAAETLIGTCRRLEERTEFDAALRDDLPKLAGDGRDADGGARPDGRTEAGMRAAGRVVEHVWDEALGDAVTEALAHSSHPRPGALRRLLTEESPRLAAHLAAGGPVRSAPWREILGRRGVSWRDRLALPVSRIPAEELLPVWSRELDEDPTLARGLLEVVCEEAARDPKAAALLVPLLDRQPHRIRECLEPLLAYLASDPGALQGKPALARALWQSLLAQPEHLAQLPEAVGEVLIPHLPAAIPPTREWAGVFLRGPQWLRAHLRERHRIDAAERGAWLQALLAELAEGALPHVPDPVATQIAALLADALRPDTWVTRTPEALAHAGNGHS